MKLPLEYGVQGSAFAVLGFKYGDGQNGSLQKYRKCDVATCSSMVSPLDPELKCIGFHVVGRPHLVGKGCPVTGSQSLVPRPWTTSPK